MRSGTARPLQAPGEPYIKNLLKLVRIAVIAEDPLVRSGLVSLLESEQQFAVVGQSGSIDEALAASNSAEILLWDVGARAQLEAYRAQLERRPTLALVRDEEVALASLRAGAMGVLPRDISGERLLAALRAVDSGLGVFEPVLVRGLPSVRAAAQESLQLTPREAEVLGLMAEGLSNKLIADRLKISEHTAKFHVNAILNKLDAETRTEAVVSAARRGLLML